MSQLSQSAIDDFIFQVQLIDPIEKIIYQLKNGEFRDCDIRWLDSKFDKFIQFAALTFGIKMGDRIEPESKNYPTMNQYVNSLYLDIFSKLLAYFKSF